MTTSDVEAILECPVCLSLYESPKQLSCGHTLCGDCINRMIETAKQERDTAAPVAAEARRPNVGLGGDENAEGRRNQMEVDADEEIIVEGEIRPADYQVQDEHHDHMQHWQFPQAEQIDFPLFRHDAQPFYYPVPNIPLVIPHPPQLRRIDYRAGRRARRDPEMRRNRNAQTDVDEGTIINCPQCRKPTAVPAGGLPVNFITRDMAALLRETHLNSSTPTDEEPTFKCDTCEGNDGHSKIFFTCSTCDPQEMTGMCSTCFIRKHNGHSVKEKRSVSAKDINNCREKVDQLTAQASGIIEEVHNLIDGSHEIFRPLVESVNEGLKLFGELGSSLNHIKNVAADDLERNEKNAQKLHEVFLKTAKIVENTIRDQSASWAGIAGQLLSDCRMALSSPGVPLGDLVEPNNNAIAVREIKPNILPLQFNCNQPGPSEVPRSEFVASRFGYSDCASRSKMFRPRRVYRDWRAVTERSAAIRQGLLQDLRLRGIRPWSDVRRARAQTILGSADQAGPSYAYAPQTEESALDFSVRGSVYPESSGFAESSTATADRDNYTTIEETQALDMNNLEEEGMGDVPVIRKRRRIGRPRVLQENRTRLPGAENCDIPVDQSTSSSFIITRSRSRYSAEADETETREPNMEVEGEVHATFTGRRRARGSNNDTRNSRAAAPSSSRATGIQHNQDLNEGAS